MLQDVVFSLVIVVCLVCMLSQMQIGLSVWLLESLFLGFVFSLLEILFLGKVRNKLLYLDLQLRLSIDVWLLLLVRSFGL